MTIEKIHLEIRRKRKIITGRLENIGINYNSNNEGSVDHV